MKKNTTDKFLIGSWVSFYPFEIDSYEYQLDQMREAGLNFNIFPCVFGGGMQDAAHWENVEKQYAARDMYYCMNGGLDDSMLSEGVAYAGGKDRCIGYHLIDEPGGAALPRVGHYVRAYREADPKRYPFVNLFPSYVGTAVMEGDYYQYCSRFVREAGPENIEYLSHDFYVFGQNGTSTGIFADMEVIRRVAFENGRLRTHAFPQSTAWNGMRMPNIDEMRWNVYGYLAYGFKALSWFNLVCPGKSDEEGEGFRDSVIYRDGTVRDKQLLKDFGSLNAEVHALGDTLMKLDTIHAYHTKNNVGGVEILPANWMITPVEDSDFIISHMISKKGDDTYVMLFNKSWESSVTASFAVSELSGIESMTYVSPFDGKNKPVSLQNGILTETFRPGEGKLFKLNGLLSYRVLPIQRNPARLNLEINEPAELMGLDVTFSADTDMKASTLQITTNKRFPEEKTLYAAFDHTTSSKSREAVPFPAGGRIRFEPYMGKYIRFTVNDEASWYNNGYAELRVRYTGEADEAPEIVEVSTAEVTHYTDVDFTELNEATTAFEALKESDYSPESWHEAHNFYAAAVAMRDGTYPQNAVTVAAWKLNDSVRALVPVVKKACKPVKAQAPQNKNVKVGKGILPVAVALLAGTAIGLATGVLISRRKRR